MPYNRGEVVLVLFPNTNLQTAKRRPALVIQADDLGTTLPQTVLAMISSNLARAGHLSRVVIPKNSTTGQQAGLLTDSVVMTDNIVTVLDIAIDRVLGQIPDMSNVDLALKHTLGIP